MLDINFYMRFSDLIDSLDKDKEYTADEMFEKLEAIRSKDPVVYNIETTNRCNMRCKMCPRTTMMTRCIEDINRDIIGKKTEAGYLWIQVDHGGNMINVGGNIKFESISAQQFVYMKDQVLSYNKEFGYIDDIAYLVMEKPLYGAIIVFTSASSEIEQNKTLAITTLIIGLAFVFLFFMLSVVLSFWLIKPVRETFDKQKRFISDASHELKTPLAVISANTDVLEAEIGENKWLGYIRSESVRMSELVNELLYLARLDDRSGKKLVMAKFNLSDVVLQTSLPFESRMFEEGKKFEVDAQENITCEGDESAIKQGIYEAVTQSGSYPERAAEIRSFAEKHHSPDNRWLSL